MAAFRVSDGQILTGDKPPKIEPAEVHNALASKLELDNPNYRMIQGYGSVFDVGYVMYDMFGPYVEYMSSKAFDASLKMKGLRVSYLMSHQGLGLATTTGKRMAIDKDEHGLGFVAALNIEESDARNLICKDEDVQHAN